MLNNPDYLNWVGSMVPAGDMMSAVTQRPGFMGLWNGDYDYLGAYQNPVPVERDGRAHFTDAYKLPNHATFSNESYYMPDNPLGAGHWVQAGLGNNSPYFYQQPINNVLRGFTSRMDY